MAEFESDLVWQAIRGCVGTGLLMAAIGIWLVRAEDAEAQMIKLIMSLGLLAGGLILLSTFFKKDKAPGLPLFVSRRGEHEPAQTATVKHAQEPLVPRVAKLPKFRHRAASSPKDGLLTVRDAAGRPIVSVPVPEQRTNQRLPTASDKS